MATRTDSDTTSPAAPSDRFVKKFRFATRTDSDFACRFRFRNRNRLGGQCVCVCVCVCGFLCLGLPFRRSVVPFRGAPPWFRWPLHGSVAPFRAPPPWFRGTLPCPRFARVPMQHYNPRVLTYATRPKKSIKETNPLLLMLRALKNPLLNGKETNCVHGHEIV